MKESNGNTKEQWENETWHRNGEGALRVAAGSLGTRTLPVVGGIDLSKPAEHESLMKDLNPSGHLQLE